MAIKLAEMMVIISVKTTDFQKKMTKIHASLRKFRDGMRGASAVAQKVFLATAGVIGITTLAAAKFEEQMASVNTMLRTQSEPLLSSYSYAVENMATKFGEGTETISKGLYDILSASVAPTKALNVLEVATKGAVGGMTTTKISADALTSVLNAYGFEAERAGEISDKLFSTVVNGKVVYEDLALTIGKAAATAAIAGISIDELLAAFSTMTRAGISAEAAMTSMVGIMRSFLKPSRAAKKAAAEIGLELNTSTLKAIGFTGVLEQLAAAQSEQVAQIVPNIRGLKGLAAVLQNMPGFYRDLDESMNSSGVAQKAFEKMNETAARDIARLKEEFIKLARAIGKEFLPAVKNILGTISNWVAWYTNLSTGNKQLIGDVLKLTAVLSGLVIILYKVSVALAALAAKAHTSAGVLGILLATIGLAINSIINDLRKFGIISKDSGAKSVEQMARVAEAAEKAKISYARMQEGGESYRKELIKIGVESTNVSDKVLKFLNLLSGGESTAAPSASRTDRYSKAKQAFTDAGYEFGKSDRVADFLLPDERGDADLLDEYLKEKTSGTTPLRAIKSVAMRELLKDEAKLAEIEDYLGANPTRELLTEVLYKQKLYKKEKNGQKLTKEEYGDLAGQITGTGRTFEQAKDVIGPYADEYARLVGLLEKQVDLYREAAGAENELIKRGQQLQKVGITKQTLQQTKEYLNILKSGTSIGSSVAGSVDERQALIEQAQQKIQRETKLGGPGKFIRGLLDRGKKFAGLLAETYDERIAVQRVKIEQIKNLDQRELALQKLKHEEEIHEARKAGKTVAQIGLIENKQKIERDILRTKQHTRSQKVRKDIAEGLMGTLTGMLSPEAQNKLKQDAMRSKLETVLGKDPKHKPAIDAIVGAMTKAFSKPQAGIWMGLADVWKDIMSKGMSPEVKELKNIDEHIVQVKEAIEALNTGGYN